MATVIHVPDTDDDTTPAQPSDGTEAVDDDDVAPMILLLLDE